MPKLLIKTGEKKGLVYRLTGRKVSIGRDPSNIIVLPDRRVSRLHANIVPQGKDYIIEDLGSVNGTSVNDETETRKVLKLGDEISVGSTVMVFLSMDTPEDVKTETSTSQVKVMLQQEEGVTVALRVTPEEADPLKVEEDQASAEDLQKAYQRLILLYRISNDLGTVVELSKLFDRILELVLDLIKADRGFIMLKDSETGELALRSVRTKAGLEDKDEIAFSKTIANHVIQTGESVLTSDASQDERFQGAESIILHGIRSAMCVPIKTKEKILGIMKVDTKGKVISFTKEDLELLTAICSQAAVAIENAKLFDDLKRANEELKEQQKQLIEAEKLSAVGQLASGVAHEINNPLTSIIGYSELSARRLAEGKTTPKDIAECVDFLKVVEGEAHRCQTIARDLLQFSRRKKAEMASISVNEAIEAALVIAKFHIKRVQIELKQDLNPQLPNIVGDIHQLQQVFLNFIINARDAINKQGTITISSNISEGEWIEIKFADSGCGIPADKLDKIFKPLFTTKEEGKGTGLGLSISQDIIERHKGIIEVESTVGQGTTFAIRLPIEK